MLLTITVMVLLSFVSLVFGEANAQTIPGDVTFEVPLNLTRLTSDITKVRVECSITSDAFPKQPETKVNQIKIIGAQVELPVLAGQLVTTARVIVPITADDFVDPVTMIRQDPTGKSAKYQCDLWGFTGVWQVFTGFSQVPDEKNPNPIRLSPAPAPISGTFTW
ncbi:MAG: hypothetical protein OEV01_01180 [Nitrospira sp.]|nr:hypothetical protein [Nitrospira sp.]MDH4302441.1 hypothetical protein [Nitrospira sp.]MDH5192556.1 hypothetical protein [Nitrospira sp.]